jgi:hypothetical protein
MAPETALHFCAADPLQKNEATNPSPRPRLPTQSAIRFSQKDKAKPISALAKSPNARTHSPRSTDPAKRPTHDSSQAEAASFDVLRAMPGV